MWPTEERTAGHDPACGPSTAKVPPAQKGASRSATSRNRLFRNRIPHTHAEIGEVGAARIAFIAQIRATHHAHRDRDRLRRAWRMNAKPRTSLRKVRPVLPFHVEREIVAPERLSPDPAED